MILRDWEGGFGSGGGGVEREATVLFIFMQAGAREKE